MTNTGRFKRILLEFSTSRYIGVDMCLYIYIGVSFLFLTMVEQREKRKNQKRSKKKENREKDLGERELGGKRKIRRLFVPIQ